MGVGGIDAQLEHPTRLLTHEPEDGLRLIKIQATIRRFALGATDLPIKALKDQACRITAGKISGQLQCPLPNFASNALKD